MQGTKKWEENRVQGRWQDLIKEGQKLKYHSLHV
jgi:hypothetical protein